MEEPRYTMSENESSIDIAMLSQSEDAVNIQLSFVKNSTEIGNSIR